MRIMSFRVPHMLVLTISLGSVSLNEIVSKATVSNSLHRKWRCIWRCFDCCRHGSSWDAQSLRLDWHAGRSRRSAVKDRIRPHIRPARGAVRAWNYRWRGLECISMAVYRGQLDAVTVAADRNRSEQLEHIAPLARTAFRGLEVLRPLPGSTISLPSERRTDIEPKKRCFRTIWA